MRAGRLIAIALLLIAGGSCTERARLSPEMERAIKERTRTDHQGLEVVRHADGSLSMDLKGRFRSVPVAHVNEQGAVEVVCE